MKHGLLGAVAVFLGCATKAISLSQSSSDHRRPVVDLGYAVHSAETNEAGDYYAFHNIRYSEAPTHENRFQPPRPVIGTDRNVNDGSVGFKCTQSVPKWVRDNPAISHSGVSSETTTNSVVGNLSESEDCLFLDVVVPRSIFHSGNSESNNKKDVKAPVMVWLHGGGYVFGDKNHALYNPHGLMARARADGSDGMIYVALNYRLGLFGWLNGNGDEDVFPNVALQDQLLAFKWVQKFIHLFGGDRKRVTVMGQSAGAGSITYHLTSSGGDGTSPFHRAIIQSPGWEHGNSTEIWEKVLTTAGLFSGQAIRTGKDLMGLDYQTLSQVNAGLIYTSSNGSFTFGPTPDGAYIPDFAERLLLDGHVDSRPQLMIGHNSNEAGAFVSPDIDSEKELRAHLFPVFNKLRSESVDHILADLYPPPSDAMPYSNQSQRAMLLVSESSFACNTRFLAVAYANATLNYRFQVPPGIHGADLPFTFYHDGGDMLRKDLAQAMQLYFTDFAKSGSDNLGNAPGLIDWPEYGDDGRILTFGKEGIDATKDPTKKARCDYWQEVEYVQ